MTSPNETDTLQNNTIEGEIDSYDPLRLTLSDDEIASTIGNRIENAKKWWDDTYNLSSVRARNAAYWNGSYYDADALYDHQVPYQNGRIFTAIETLVPMANANPPQPVVLGWDDDPAKIESAKDLQTTLLAKYEDLYLKQKFELVTRHILGGQRIGVMKYRWDDEAGPLNENGERMGDVDVMVLQPTNVVIEKRANNPDDVPLIAEYLETSVEELAIRFPKKQTEIWKELGIQRGVSSQLSKRVGYWETWFTYYQQNKKLEGMAWKYGNTVLGSMKNPNWNYEERDFVANEPTNYFSRPHKPYIFFNHLNFGRYVIDDTSLVEQSANLQDVLDKRGRQIIENADSANSGIIYNTQMIKPEEMAKLIGDPNEKIGVDGDVRQAFARFAPNQLPNYVMEDKNDARMEIDNIFGTHAPVRGEEANAPTLGQEVMSQRADISRIKTLATSMEVGADRLYKGLTQMFKVFYDEERRIRNESESGEVDFVRFSGKRIDPRFVVRVKTGSVLPDDPVAKAQEALKLSPILDPYSLAEGLGKKNPKEFAKRLMYFRMFPDKYMTDILQIDPAGENQADPSALQEIEALIQGMETPPQPQPTKEHLATHQQHIDSPKFQELPPEIQQAVIAHVKAEMNAARGALNQDTQEEPMENPERDQGILSRILGRVRGGEVNTNE